MTNPLVTIPSRPLYLAFFILIYVQKFNGVKEKQTKQSTTDVRLRTSDNPERTVDRAVSGLHNGGRARSNGVEAGKLYFSYVWGPHYNSTKVLMLPSHGKSSWDAVIPNNQSSSTAYHGRLTPLAYMPPLSPPAGATSAVPLVDPRENKHHQCYVVEASKPPRSRGPTCKLGIIRAGRMRA